MHICLSEAERNAAETQRGPVIGAAAHMGRGRGREEEEGGREGGKAAGRAGVTEIWQGGGIPSFTPHVLLYSRRPSKHISASPARLSQPSYPGALHI